MIEFGIIFEVSSTIIYIIFLTDIPYFGLWNWCK